MFHFYLDKSDLKVDLTLESTTNQTKKNDSKTTTTALNHKKKLIKSDLNG